MAEHLRTQITAAAVAALTGLVTTGANVFASRVYQLQEAELPALLVTAAGELVGAKEIGYFPRYYERTMNLQVEAVAQLNDGLDETLNRMCKEIEVALAMPCATFAGLVKLITLRAIGDPQFSREGAQPIGSVALTFEVFYMTAENAPDTPL